MFCTVNTSSKLRRFVVSQAASLKVCQNSSDMRFSSTPSSPKYDSGRKYESILSFPEEFQSQVSSGKKTSPVPNSVFLKIRSLRFVCVSPFRVYVYIYTCAYIYIFFFCLHTYILHTYIPNHIHASINVKYANFRCSTLWLSSILLVGGFNPSEKY